MEGAEGREEMLSFTVLHLHAVLWAAETASHSLATDV